MGSRTIRKKAKTDEPPLYDFYETPFWATLAIVPWLPDAIKVCDPCAGRGAILRALQHGYRPSFAHLPDEPKQSPSFYGFEIRQDLVSFEPGHPDIQVADALATDWGKPDLVVMNPPYSQAETFVRRALAELAPQGTLAVLLRLGFVATQARRMFWKGRQADLYVFERRPNFRGSGSDASEYAWFMFGPGCLGRWMRLEAEKPSMQGCKRPEKILLDLQAEEIVRLAPVVRML